MTKEKAKVVLFLLYLFISDSVEKEMDEMVGKINIQSKYLNLLQNSKV